MRFVCVVRVYVCGFANFGRANFLWRSAPTSRGGSRVNENHLSGGLLDCRWHGGASRIFLFREGVVEPYFQFDVAEMFIGSLKESRWNGVCWCEGPQCMARLTHALLT